MWVGRAVSLSRSFAFHDLANFGSFVSNGLDVLAGRQTDRWIDFALHVVDIFITATVMQHRAIC